MLICLNKIKKFHETSSVEPNKNLDLATDSDLQQRSFKIKIHLKHLSNKHSYQPKATSVSQRCQWRIMLSTFTVLIVQSEGNKFFFPLARCILISVLGHPLFSVKVALLMPTWFMTTRPEKSHGCVDGAPWIK